jgi:hypothetical protein
VPSGSPVRGWWPRLRRRSSGASGCATRGRALGTGPAFAEGQKGPDSDCHHDGWKILYDAGSYKAAPVPMALDFGIVYEGFRSGVSQGVFTITQPGQLNHLDRRRHVASGGSEDPGENKKYSPPVIATMTNGPPVLHRRAEKTDSDSGFESDSAARTKTRMRTRTSRDQQKPLVLPRLRLPGAPAARRVRPGPAPRPDRRRMRKSACATGDREGISIRSGGRAESADPNRPRLRRGKAGRHCAPRSLRNLRFFAGS